MAQLILKAATVYLPGGKVKRFEPGEVVAWGMTPSGAVVATKNGNEITKYVGFPTVLVEEESQIERAPAPGIVLG